MIIAALMLMSTAFVFAENDKPNTIGFAIVPAKGSEVFKVVYKSEVASRVKLTIYNASHDVVFVETIFGVSGFIRPLNFSGLAAGEYTIELADASGKRVEKIFYQPKSSLKQVHVSKIANEAGKYLLAIANEGDETVTINILDENNDLVHTESKTIKGDFAQVYKLNSATSAYTFQVTDKAGNIKTIKF